MKKFALFFRSIAFVAIALTISCCLFSCDCDDDPKIEKSLFGTAVSSQQNVHNGDEIYLSIGPVKIDETGSISVESSTTINGKEIGVPMVHYYIDDKEVGKSNDPSTKFAVKYIVKDLSIGNHTLSATAEPQEKGTTFIGSYTSSSFNVVED